MKAWWIDRNNHFAELKDGSAEWASLPILKFILLRTSIGELEVYCFEDKLEHKAGVYLALGHVQMPPRTFVGGGTILRPSICHAQFGSPTCVQEFKFDRPTDAHEQGVALQEVTDAIRAAGYGTP